MWLAEVHLHNCNIWVKCTSDHLMWIKCVLGALTLAFLCGKARPRILKTNEMTKCKSGLRYIFLK